MRAGSSRRAHRGHHDYAGPETLPFLVGIAVGVLVITAAWGGVWLYTSGDEQPPSGVTQSLESAAPTARLASTQDNCREVLARQGETLRAGAAPLSQWKVHIRAMNQLVSGAITLDEARAFWEGTRVGAKQNLAAFGSVQRRLDSRAEGCPGFEAAHAAHMEGSCAAAVAARGPALRALDTALGTWAEHVHHMEMLRMGHLSPERAGQMWLASWHTGVEQVRRYQEAARDSRHVHC